MVRCAIRREQSFAERLSQRVMLEATPRDWQTLVEQIAELEDLLGEDPCTDPDAHVGRDWLRRLLADKRRRLRDIDVAL